MPTLVEKLKEAGRFELGIEHITGLRNLEILNTIKYGNLRHNFQVFIRSSERVGFLGAHYAYILLEGLFAHDVALGVLEGDYKRVRNALAIAGLELIKYATYKLSDDIIKSMSQLPTIKKHIHNQ